MEERTIDKGVSRRKFMLGTGTLALGAALSQLGGVISKADAKEITAKQWPWPYEKLDPAKTAEIAYNEWYRIYCGGAVMNSIFSQLAEKVGEPYKSFPVDAFAVLYGGINEWGTVCGTLAGANIASCLIIGPWMAGPKSELGHVIGSNVMEWYSTTNLPIYVPKNPKANKGKIIQTTSDSPLCHVSVGKWMKKSGYAFDSAERKDRCARLAASVAYKLAGDLNAWKDGKYHEEIKWFAPDSVHISSQQNCSDCHGSNIPSPPTKK